MIAMLHNGGFTRAQYDDRFERPATRTFRRDIDDLREAGLYVIAPRPGVLDRRFHMTCFRSEAEAA